MRLWVWSLLLVVGQSQSAVQVQPSRAFGGKTVPLRFAVTDVPKDKTSVTFSFTLSSHDLLLAKGQGNVPVKNGQGKTQLPLALPSVCHPTRAILTVSANGQKFTQPFWLFPSLEETLRPLFANPQVVFINAPDRVRQLAKRLGGKAKFVRSGDFPKDGRVFIVEGESELQAVGEMPPLPTVLLLGKPKEGVPLPSLLTTTTGEHPLLQEISPEWLSGWSGAFGMRLPAKINCRALVVGHRSQPPFIVTPLIERFVEGRKLLLCSLPLLRQLTEEPAAASLLMALVRYGAELEAFPPPKKPFVALADPKTPKGETLARMGFTVTPTLPSEGRDIVLLVDPATADPQTVGQKLAKGGLGFVLLLGLTPSDLAAWDWLLPWQTDLLLLREGETVPVQSDPLTVGLTGEWLKRAMEGDRVYRLRFADDPSVRHLANGVAAFWEKQGTKVLAWQVPFQKDLGQAALCQLLTNLLRR